MDTLFTSCLQKQEELKILFLACTSPDARYQKIIELGKALAPFDPAYKVEGNIVQGCQSTMYLHSSIENGKITFTACSEALISAGLAALLLYVYNEESPEAILKVPATYLQDLGIHASLTPGRSNGLSSMYLRMKQEALKHLVASSHPSP